METGQRNILIHDYDDVNLNIVWDTAQKNLPPLIAKYGSLSRRTPADRRVKAGPRTTVWPLSQGTRRWVATIGLAFLVRPR